MRYRISEIKINPYDVAGESGGISRDKLAKSLELEIRKAAGKKAGSSVTNVEIVRESVDARRKGSVKLVYTADFDCQADLPYPEAKPGTYTCPEPANTEGSRPVVVGFGPCGIFAGLVLAEAGLRPVIIERGKSVDERVKDVEAFWAEGAGGDAAPDPESNVQYGEGGAGTFSDGKLTTGIKDPRIRKVLEEFVKAGADPEILYKHKPHIGTDRLREIVKNLRMKIESMGGEVRFRTRLESIETAEGQIRAVVTSGGRIETDYLVLAIGHSARDTFGMLHDAGIHMEQKPFSIGVRIEHSQKDINRIQYGDEKLAGILGAADYKISYRCPETGRGVYTFCMCPGGVVVNASTEPGTSVTNGMSYSGRNSEYANSALLVDVRREDFDGDHPLAGMKFQEKYEKLAWENRTAGGMARTTYGEFRSDGGNAVRQSLPDFAQEAIIEAMPHLARKLKGFDRDDSVMTAVETRSSSPVRITRDEQLQSVSCKGLIPAGEGPGYAGGIMSAAVDGIRAAEQIILLK